jgi:Ca2+-binding RTX toxin-like protein
VSNRRASLAVAVASGLGVAAFAAVASGQSSDYYPGCPDTTRTIVGTEGPDRINGTAAAELILTLGANDIADGRGNRDCILLGPGNDRGTGSGQADRVDGEGGRDRVAGGTGNDTVLGGSGNDIGKGNAGNDKLSGEDGQDRVSGGPGKDRSRGNRGNDKAFGGSGNDRVSGGPGNDFVRGNANRDFMSGGSGNDRINAFDRTRDRSVNCGPGRDRAVIDRIDPVSRNCEVVVRRG